MSDAPHKSTISERYYGWRPSLPDINDRKMPMPNSEVSLPSEVQLNVPKVPAPFNPAWNQGSLGSCGPHSMARDIVYAALKQDKAASVPMPSRLFIYYNTRLLMGTVNEDSGVDNGSLVKAVAKYGWADETLWPYDIQNFRKRPPVEAYQQAATRRLIDHFVVPQTLVAMKTCLAGKDPFIFGFSVYESFESPMVQSTGMVPMPKRGERQVGGHDVTMIGYNDSMGCFIFYNSWGEWGQGGIGYMPYAYATNPELSGDFRTIRTSLLAPSTPPPPIPPVNEFDLSIFGLPYLIHYPAKQGDDVGFAKKAA